MLTAFIIIANTFMSTSFQQCWSVSLLMCLNFTVFIQPISTICTLPSQAQVVDVIESFSPVIKDSLTRQIQRSPLDHETGFLQNHVHISTSLSEYSRFFKLSTLLKAQTDIENHPRLLPYRAKYTYLSDQSHLRSKC